MFKALSRASVCQCAHPLIGRVSRRIEAVPFQTAGLEAARSSPAERQAESDPFAAWQTDQGLILHNIRLFDGIQAKVQHNLAVRIDKARITQVLPLAQLHDEQALLVDGQGLLLMPGLIDAHWHTTLCGITQIEALTADVPYIHLRAAREAHNTLLRGFTSVRDVGGPSFSLKRAIDEQLMVGPRIFPSGAMISQTSGHGDFRMRSEVPRQSDYLGHAERAGMAAIADGPDEVLRRAREQLMLGASQIKLMAGGGVASTYDPLDSVQYFEQELRQAVQAAEDWGTYVMVHVYHTQGIQRALRAGVRSIEHGQLADEETVRMMADQGVWWSLQPFLADEDSNKYADPVAQANQKRVAQGTVRAFEMAQRFKVKTAWGTDILFTPQNLTKHGRMLSKLTRFYSPLDALMLATGNNGQLLSMSGLRHPYGGAELGVIKAGALADMLLVDGDPEKNLDFLTTPEQSLRLIMKDGQVYKNDLAAHYQG